MHLCAANALYGPVATCFVTYAVELMGAATDYQLALLASAAVKETEFVAEDESYATPPR